MKLRNKLVVAFLMVSITSCTSMVEGTWVAGEDRIIIDQNLDDPNSGTWEYYRGEQMIYRGDYVFNPYENQLGFTNELDNASVFLGILSDKKLMFIDAVKDKTIEFEKP